MKAKSLMDKMTLRERIAQTAVARQNLLVAEADLQEHLKNNPYGCMWVMGNQKLEAVNLAEESGSRKSLSKNYKRWFDKLDGYLKVPILTAMDAEKGANTTFSDLTMATGAPAIGAAGSEELAFRQGACIAEEIKCAGVHWWWSPVVDIASRFNAVSVGRSFSDDVDMQIRMACSVIRGMQSKKVAAGVKHFPGADLKEYRDAHITQTAVSTPFEEWEQKQGRIFKAAIDAGVWSVMVGHAAFPAVDDTVVNETCLPSTLSHKVITGLLKGRMGFKGVAVTDAIGMAGLSTLYPRERLYVELLKAGNDAILGPTKLDYVDIVEKAVLSGELAEERINDACLRVLELKEKTGLLSGNPAAISGPELSDRILEDNRSVCKEIAEKAVTLVCDKKKRLPFRKDEVKHVAIICSTHVDVVFEALNTLQAEFEKRGAEVSMQRRLKSGSECEQIARDNDLIIYAAFLGPHKPMGASSFYDQEFLTFIHAFLYGKEKSIGVSFGSPYIYYDFYTNADIFVNAYHYSDELQKAFVAAIYGEIPFVGRSPFKLIPD